MKLKKRLITIKFNSNFTLLEGISPHFPYQCSQSYKNQNDAAIVCRYEGGHSFIDKFSKLF